MLYSPYRKKAALSVGWRFQKSPGSALPGSKRIKGSTYDLATRPWAAGRPKGSAHDSRATIFASVMNGQWTGASAIVDPGSIRSRGNWTFSGSASGPASAVTRLYFPLDDPLTVTPHTVFGEIDLGESSVTYATL